MQLTSRCGRPLDFEDYDAYKDLLSSSQVMLQAVIALLNNRIIRRDLTSRQQDGTLIIDLPPMMHVKVELSMSAQDRIWFERVMQENLSSQRRLRRVSRKVRVS